MRWFVIYDVVVHEKRVINRYLHILRHVSDTVMTTMTKAESRARAFLHFPSICAIAEPRGSVRPNVRDKDVNGLRRDILIELMVGLPCPVQGFPAPTFRYRQLPPICRYADVLNNLN